MTEDGKQALMTLSGGDMRRVINVLQSTWLAFGSVTEENVYNCVGHPLPIDIKNIVNWLLNETYEFAYNSILFRSKHLFSYSRRIPGKKACIV